MFLLKVFIVENLENIKMYKENKLSVITTLKKKDSRNISTNQLHFCTQGGKKSPLNQFSKHLKKTWY